MYLTIARYVVVTATTADPGNERYKLSFTIRDTPTDYINVTCWGSELFITNIHHSFKIYDVGKYMSHYHCHYCSHTVG